MATLGSDGLPVDYQSTETMAQTGTRAPIAIAKSSFASGERGVACRGCFAAKLSATMALLRSGGTNAMNNVNESTAINVQALWEKYEDIAMHFNDLLIQLRTRSLGAVAAVSAVVGIFANKDSTNLALDWVVAAFLFLALLIFWIALFLLDFFYYNKLLSGAVTALTELEALTLKKVPVPGINLSTLIEKEFTQTQKHPSMKGVLWFYGIVCAFLILSALFSLRMHQLYPAQPVHAGKGAK